MQNLTETFNRLASRYSEIQGLAIKTKQLWSKRRLRMVFPEGVKLNFHLFMIRQSLSITITI